MEHPIIIDILILVLGVYLGIQFTSLYIKISLDKETKKFKENIKSIFNEISTNVRDKKANFLYRINNTVRFETELKKLGTISVYFYLSKSEILIFKNDEALYTSKDLDNDLLIQLDYLLKISFSNQINDTVNIFGTIYSRKYFTDTFKINLENMGFFQENEFDENLNIVDEDIYDIDTILDKINLVGYEKLSLKEKEFLKKYSNG